MSDFEKKNSEQEEFNNWKNRFSELIGMCQEEIKRTTKIGKKMLHATSANSKLNETYEEIGRLAVKHLECNLLQWENSTAKELVEKVKSLEADLNRYEEELKQIKKN